MCKLIFFCNFSPALKFAFKKHKSLIFDKCKNIIDSHCHVKQNSNECLNIASKPVEPFLRCLFTWVWRGRWRTPWGSPARCCSFCCRRPPRGRGRFCLPSQPPWRRSSRRWVLALGLEYRERFSWIRADSYLLLKRIKRTHAHRSHYFGRAHGEKYVA